MPHSVLAYRDLPPARAPARATVVALHGGGGWLDDLAPLARSLGPDLRVVLPEAARGLVTFRETVGHVWYGGRRIERPEPSSFGDNLAQLERFVHDVRERADAGEPRPEGPRPWLLGYDQGAVLALSLAAIAPDLIAGVMAVCGCLPTFSDPDLLEYVAADLPILLIGDPDTDAPPASTVEATATRFAELGARVTTEWIAGAKELHSDVTVTLRTWLDDQLGR
jgi:phospholipase/carboxylesterase